jgi:anthranilate phosphoribosyltransferase
VLLNSAAALIVSGRTSDLREGAEMAAGAIDDGRAARLLARVREISRS